MSSACIRTVVQEGMNAINIEVQVQIINGQPALGIVGLGDKAINESKERVKAAINAIGLSIPAKKITINLAPSDILKEGSHFDLPIAIGILTAMGIFNTDKIKDYIIMGELALDGRIMPVNGVLPAAMFANNFELGIICPFDNSQEAVIASKTLEIIAPMNLQQLVNHFRGSQFIQRPILDRNVFENRSYSGDFFDVRGQYITKRAMEVAASGGHHILMYGPPGTGKSMLAHRILSILPNMSSDEILECGILKSISGNSQSNMFSPERPYRDPHHSISLPALIGGGRSAKPGEISLAHNGILFLDEIAEFQPSILDGLRQPLENGHVTINRVNADATYPAKFQLIAAMNPCRCGYYGDPARECKKAPGCAQDYQKKISGPILDRIDIHVEVSNFIPSIEDNGDDRGEKSTTIKERVLNARMIQENRYKDSNISINSELSGSLINQFCVLSENAKKTMQKAIDKLNLSMRSYNKILKISRTIADINQNEKIEDKDLLEAIGYRSKIINTESKN